MQAKMTTLQKELETREVEASSGGGMVKVQVNGEKALIGLEIDDSLINLTDKNMMRDLVIAAVNKAVAEADIQSKEHIKKSTEGLMPNIPGMDLSGMM